MHLNECFNFKEGKLNIHYHRICCASTKQQQQLQTKGAVGVVVSTFSSLMPAYLFTVNNVVFNA